MKIGKERVVIENIQPSIDGGSVPVKRAVGEWVEVTADIFGDGHDHVRAIVKFQRASSGEWDEVDMQSLGNDLWKAAFKVSHVDRYLFTVEAWIDHFETWHDGIKKKINAKTDVHLELLEGANYLKEAAPDHAEAKALAKTLSDKEQYTLAIQEILTDGFSEIVTAYPLKRIVTTCGREFEVAVESKRVTFTTWYEFFPRSGSLTPGKHGTFKDCIRLLPRIASMGFDVLYFPPIHPVGKMHRKGKNNSVRSLPGEPGSPWAIGNDEGGHKSIHAELGTLEDYKKLIAEAKKLGIDIAFDLAFQCAPDHPYVKEHPEWFYIRPDGSIQYAENPPKKYQDIYPFNFECDDQMALWEELKSVIVYWIEQGVKIFRVDNPHTKPILFWEWAIAEVREEYSDIIFLAEAFTRPKVMASLAKAGFNQSYTYFTWRVSKQEIVEYMEELVQGPSRNYFRPNFWPNTPDILPYHLQYQGDNSFILRLALAATLSSNYGIYGPPFEFYENTPVEGKEEYLNSEKYEIKTYDWKKTNRMTDIITLVNKARRENAALQSTWNLEFCAVENPNLIAFVKATDDLSSIILVVLSLDAHHNQSGYVQLPRTYLRLQDKVNLKLHDLITEEHYTWTQEWNFVQLSPHKMPFHLFKAEIHESNM